jgi:hypothetical protein
MRRARLDALAMRAFLMSIRSAADAALHLLDSVQSSSPGVQSSSSPATVQASNGTAGRSLDARASSSEISSSPQDSEDLDEDESKREARPELASNALGLTAGRNIGLDAGLKPGQHTSGAALANCWDGIGGLGCNGEVRALMVERLPLIEKLAAERGLAPLVLFQRACDRFKADPSIAGKRLKTARVLLSQLEKPPPSGPPAIVSPARRLLNPAPKESAS